MNNDQLDDLKQFISASVSQSEARLREDLKEWISTSIAQSEGNLRQEIQVVRQEMADGFLAVGEAIEEIHQQLEAQHTKHEAVDKRLTTLERRMA